MRINAAGLGRSHRRWQILIEKSTREIFSALIQQDEASDVDYKKEVKLLEEMYIEELQPFDDKGYNKRAVKR